jgi:hypothetical protein
MDPEQNQSLPFVTRDMLDFKHNSVWQLRIQTRSLNTDDLTIRGATKQSPFVYRVTLDGLDTLKTDTFKIGDIPIFMTAGYSVDAGNESGDTFISVELILNGNPIFSLMSGYIHDQVPISYPYSNVRDSDPLLGFPSAIFSTDPAAGVEPSITLPVGFKYKLLGIRVRLVCAAVAGSRRPHFSIQTGSGFTYDLFSLTDQIISETKDYTVAPSWFGTAFTNDNDILVPMPSGIILLGNDVITTQTFNLNAGDNYTAMTAFVEKFKT